MADEPSAGPPDESAAAAAATQEDVAAKHAARTERIEAFLAEKWQDDVRCPFCRTDNWYIDPVPVLWQRLNSPLGIGVPVFLVICTNCGFEVPLGAAFIGMWDVLDDVTADETHVRRAEPDADPVEPHAGGANKEEPT